MTPITFDPVPVPADAQARVYLRTLTAGAPAGAFLELRAIDRGRVDQSFWPVADIAGAASSAVKMSAQVDVYAGVVPRAREAGGRNAVVPPRMAWVDCDSTSAMQALATFDSAPQMVVESSPGHAHAYWPLRQSASADAIEDPNRRLAHRLGADPKCCDAARILRVAGTFNHKPEHGKPAPVRFIRVEPTRAVTLEELVGDLPLPDPEPVESLRRAEPRPVDGGSPRNAALKRIPAEAYVPALLGRPVSRGHVRCAFHKGGQERTPSLHVYGRNGQAESWYCFGCEAGGDIFDFGARLFGLSTRHDFPALVDRLTDELGRCGRGLAMSALPEPYRQELEHADAEEKSKRVVALPTSRAAVATTGRRLVARKASTIKPQRARWLWDSRIPMQNLSVLVGPGGRGKSTLSMLLAAAVTRGTLPDDCLGTPAGVLIISYEDGESHVIVPRLMAAGADLERVSIVSAEDSIGLVSFPDDVDELGRLAEDEGARLVIIDPLVAGLRSQRTDSHNDQSVREALAPLQQLAESHDIAVLAVMHPPKGRGGGDPNAYISGSGAFYNAPRAVMIFDADRMNRTAHAAPAAFLFSRSTA